ncbi:hypothetical protein ACJIZ3_006394 [Penstemon smallii]|uniref:Uncharacterized protein n=1 Tax=Penstemon smallii TaxID=265156 RepID=A0ABD3S7J0_9LAMI
MLIAKRIPMLKFLPISGFQISDLPPQFREQSNLFHSNRQKTEENPFLLLPISGTTD